MSRGGVNNTSKITRARRSGGSNVEPPETIRFGTNHEDSASTVVGDHFAFITNMNNLNMLLCEMADQNQIPPKIWHIQDIFELKMFVHTINSGKHCDITNASNIKEVIISNGDTLAVIMN